MKNFKMVIQYDGSRYDGWQKQGNTDQTIQGKLEAILEKLEGAPVEVHGSGRTDAGVHATGQVANVHLSCAKLREQSDSVSFENVADATLLIKYINQYLPEDISVVKLEEVPERFHSRLNTTEKTYTYFIEMGEKKSVFQRKYIYGLGKMLDIQKIRQATALLEGEHDFTSFCGNKKMKKSAVRTVSSIQVKDRGSQLELIFIGNGFLQNMVRIMVGTLIEVGLSQRAPETMIDVLAAKDRQMAGYTVPAEGLFLSQVRYGSMS